LFYGPEGTGKTLMVRAIATETKAIVFDMSPAATMDVYNAGRTDADKLVASVMKCAATYQPAIIYIDEAEKVWAMKKKKKKGQKGGGRGPKNDLCNP
jgi:ATP-dependent 26S proteasome regulatory subunit